MTDVSDDDFRCCYCLSAMRMMSCNRLNVRKNYSLMSVRMMDLSRSGRKMTSCWVCYRKSLNGKKRMRRMRKTVCCRRSWKRMKSWVCYRKKRKNLDGK